MFLAHLSRRLRGELIVYQSSRRPSVHPCVCACIRVLTLSNINISETNGSITTKRYQKHHWSGGWLHNVLGQIGSELWFPWQQKAPIGLLWRKRCLIFFSAVYHPILFILAGNDDMHESSDEFEFPPARTTGCRVSCP